MCFAPQEGAGLDSPISVNPDSGKRRFDGFRFGPVFLLPVSTGDAGIDLG